MKPAALPPPASASCSPNKRPRVPDPPSSQGPSERGQEQLRPDSSDPLEPQAAHGLSSGGNKEAFRPLFPCQHTALWSLFTSPTSSSIHIYLCVAASLFCAGGWPSQDACQQGALRPQASRPPHSSQHWPTLVASPIVQICERINNLGSGALAGMDLLPHDKLASMDMSFEDLATPSAARNREVSG